MKTLLKITSLIALSCCFICTQAKAQQKHIAVDSKFINYGGSLHLVQQGDSLLLNRHSEELFSKSDTRISRPKAITSSGIYIEFKSDSKSIKMLFSDQPNGSYRTPILGVYKDGIYMGTMSMRKAELINDSDQAVSWKVFMPIFYSAAFKGLEIDPDKRLYAVQKSKRPIYFAIGNSITHGVGQAGVSSDKTYAGVLAEAKSWEMYNLAVGGSQISPSIADEFKNIKADYITILWGYNDWNSGNVSFDEIQSRYTDLLQRLRKNQPKAKIYVITPTFTTTLERKNGDKTPISEVKEIQEKIVASMVSSGDKLIFIIDGASMTSAEDLKDYVHLNTEGAQKFGENLSLAITD